MREWVTILIATLILAVGGCAGAPAHRGNGPLPVPLGDDMVVSAPQAAALHQAEERAIVSCMAQRGFSYEPVPVAPRQSTDNPYGLLSESEAATNGYGLSATALAGPVKDPNEQVVAQLPIPRRDAWHDALLGTGRHQATLSAPGVAPLQIDLDGCVHVARDSLYGKDWEQAQLTVEGLVAQIVAQVTTDQGFVTAQTSWAACMKANGENLATLQQARGLVQDAVATADGDRAALQNVGRRELHVAVVDAGCQRVSDLADAVRAAQERSEARLPASSRQAVVTVVAGRDRVLRSVY